MCNHRASGVIGAMNKFLMRLLDAGSAIREASSGDSAAR